MMREDYSCEVEYDPEFDFLSFKRLNFKSTGSITAGSFTIDFEKNTLSGIEVERATSLFQSFFGSKIDFSKISKAKIGFQEKKNMMLLFFQFVYENQVFSKDVVVAQVEPIPAVV